VKIIFLDIDGVLNSEQHVHEMGNEWDGNQIDPKAVARLNKITDATDALIVVSSSWRLDHSLQALRWVLSSNGVKAHILGVTGDNRLDRSDQIWDWIDAAQKKSNIEAYVILDDDRLESKRDNSDPVIDQHFVRTSWFDGLQDRHIDRAINILNNKL
jgi:hypothetical protein